MTSALQQLARPHSLAARCRWRAGGSRWPAAGGVRCSSSSSSEPSSSGGDGSGGAADGEVAFRGFDRRSSKAPKDIKGLSTPEALQNTLAGLSDIQGRVANSNNIILGATDSEEKWRELDEQVNEYPGQRTFKAIGPVEGDFVVAMERCVSSVIGTVHAECVNQRYSGKGKYVSITVGPVWVETPEQVLQIYENMKADGRMRFFF